MKSEFHSNKTTHHSSIPATSRIKLFNKAILNMLFSPLCLYLCCPLYFECSKFLLSNFYSSFNMFPLYVCHIWSHFCHCTCMMYCNAWIMCLSHQLGFQLLPASPGCWEVGGAHTTDFFLYFIIISSSCITSKVPLSSGSSRLILLFFPELETWPTPGDTISHSPPALFFLNSTGSQK